MKARELIKEMIVELIDKNSEQHLKINKLYEEIAELKEANFNLNREIKFMKNTITFEP
jgi:uncharacterized coiled-coil DUF342 family protein